jgi:radical SAM protein with 4Fe4S-binding SPASM domain
MMNLSSPDVVTWECTSSCNLRCIHCSTDSGVPRKGEMDTREVLDLVDNLSAMKVLKMGIDGGEPLLREDILLILQYASEKGIYVNISTNGTLLNKKVVQNLSETKLRYVQVSVDGSNQFIHDKIRGVRGTWGKAMSGIKEIVDYQIPLMITSVLMTVNRKDMKNMALLAYHLGAATFRILDIVPSGRATHELVLPLAEKKESDLEIRKIQKEFQGTMNVVPPTTKFDCFITGNTQSRQTYATLLAPEGHFFCEAGTILCTVKYTGEVIPCTYFPDAVAGNVTEEGFQRIWDEDSRWGPFRNFPELSGKCRTCRFSSQCMGGCRAHSFVTYGRLDCPDPRCWYEGDGNGSAC